MTSQNNLNAPTPFSVSVGGSGVMAFALPYGIICAGATSTATMQTIGSLGSEGQVFTSNGPGGLGSFQNIPSQAFPVVEITSTTQSAAINTIYITNNGGLVTVTLPAVSAQGSSVWIVGKGAGGWKLQANSGQTIVWGNQTSTSGGSWSSSNQYDCMEVFCITANTVWICRGIAQGDITPA